MFKEIRNNLIFSIDKNFNSLMHANSFVLLDVRLCGNSCSSLVNRLEAAICFTSGHVCLSTCFVQSCHLGHFDNRNSSIWLLCCLERWTFYDLFCKYFYSVNYWQGLDYGQIGTKIPNLWLIQCIENFSFGIDSISNKRLFLI